MRNILQADFYRLMRFKVFYFAFFSTILIVISLLAMHSQDINFGLSIFGELTTFTHTQDIINMGLNFQKGLGVIITIALSLFIGSEYQWQTWQLKIYHTSSRKQIYVATLMISMGVALIIFFSFQLVVLLGSICFGIPLDFISITYLWQLMGGMLIYLALASILCFFSMVLKSQSGALIANLGYVLMVGSLIELLANGVNTLLPLKFLVTHTLYPLNLIVLNPTLTQSSPLSFILNILFIIGLSTSSGYLIFSRYEL